MIRNDLLELKFSINLECMSLVTVTHISCQKSEGNSISCLWVFFHVGCWDLCSFRICRELKTIYIHIYT